MSSRYLVASLLILAACGEPAANTSETAAPAVSAQTLTTAEVTHGAEGTDFLITWDVTPANSPVRVEVSTDPAFVPGEGQVISKSNSEGKLNWTSDGERVRRYFAIIPENGAALKTAVRLLPLEGGRNFRDLGGYETADGRHVKWGRVFRSGQMSGITDADYDYLSGLGVKTVCDFRDADERTDEPTNWRASDIAYLTFADPAEDNDANAAMFGAMMDPNSTPADVTAGMAAGYHQIAYQEAEGYTVMFDELAAGKIPLAFNCSAGKDRAGTAAALILTALGVPHETVVHDYSLSDDYVDYMSEFLGPEQRAEAAANPDHPYAFLFQLPPEKVAPLLSSDPVFIETSFATLAAEHGSVMNFIQNELDVTDEEIEAIRASLLE